MHFYSLLFHKNQVRNLSVLNKCINQRKTHLWWYYIWGLSLIIVHMLSISYNTLAYVQIYHVEFWNKHVSSCICISGKPGMGSSRTRCSAPRQSGRHCPLSSWQPRQYWPAYPAWQRKAGVVLLGTFVVRYPDLLALLIISLDGVFSLTTET